MYKMLLLASLIYSSAFCLQIPSNDSIFTPSDSITRYEKMFRAGLKRAKGTDKEQHCIKNIDFIYAMATKKSHRWDKFKWSFTRYGINPYRFTMFSPRSISSNIMSWTCLHGEHDFARILAKKMVRRKIHGKKKNVLVKQRMRDNNFGFIHKKMSRTQLARTLSHISIIKDAVDRGYEHIWILNSGTTMRCDPNILSQIIERANSEIPGWTTLYTDYGERDESDNLEPIGRFYYRPDVEFKDAEEYLSREKIAEETNEFTDYQDDSDDQDFVNSCETGINDNSRRYWNHVGYKTNTPKDTFSKVGLTRGAHSYILNRKGINLIWNWYVEHRVFIPYWLEIQIIPGMEPYYVPTPITRNQNSS